MIRNIVQYPNEILFERSSKIDIKRINEYTLLIQDMIEVMQSNNGIGIAAVQIGIPIRIFIAEDKVFINPVIFECTKETKIELEKCLSCPNEEIEVERPKMISIKYYDENGRVHKEIYEGMKARVILHEFDHLNGKLIINHKKER